MRLTAIAVIFAAATLAGCQTTEDAQVSVRGSWVGQPVDAFFSANGPPISRYEGDAGLTIYTWRGGETSYTRPARVITAAAPSTDIFRTSKTKTRSNTRNTAPGRSITRSRSTSTSFSISAPGAPAIIEPARTVELFCEAQITTNEARIITNVRISRDTDGEGLASFSRCAELFARS